MPLDLNEFARRVRDRVPAYRDFLATRNTPPEADFKSLPLLTKQNYLLGFPTEALCWDGSLAACHLIGASSGFSKSGTIFWPKRPEDELHYLDGIEGMLVDNYAIDRKRTLILVCLAFGTWIGGMQLASACRILAAQGKHPITVSTPSLNIGEAIEIYARFGHAFEQVLWLTNPSNVQLVSALLTRRELTPPPAQMSFGVVGEYYSEAFREWVAERFGHPVDDPYCIWTGYGSADTGGIGVETRASIAVRKHLHHHPEICRALFQTDAAPMLLAPSPDAHVESIEGNIVCTKDQLIPLVRYDTGDAGGLIDRATLTEAGLPPELVGRAPETMVYVHGRASDTIIFYGTNLRLSDINDYLLGQEEYGGFYELAEDKREGITRFVFTLYVTGRRDEPRRQQYQRGLVAFLERESREFAAKYDALSTSVGEPLVDVRLEDAAQAKGRIKHRYLVQTASQEK
jgi:phenylacetate-CoA ligase